VFSPYFKAFCLKHSGNQSAKIGLTVPRAFGKAVLRNRVKRRFREAVRLNLAKLGEDWMIVINPRRSALNAPLPELCREVERLFARCGDPS
jgi:ribonuclease P protein component